MRLRGTSAYQAMRERAKAFVSDPSLRCYGGQFGEDACLFSYFASQRYGQTRSLNDVGNGFYVDVGAYDPIDISNTRIFYERGWRGINIDLSSATIEAFQRHRPADINLHCAVSLVEGELDFFSFGPESVYNTLDSPAAENYARRLGVTPCIEKVRAVPLSKLLADHLPSRRGNLIPVGRC